MEGRIIFLPQLTFANLEDFLKRKKEINKIKKFPLLEERFSIRDILIYYDKKGIVSYIVQDWTDDRKNFVGYKHFFAKELYKHNFKLLRNN